MAASPKKSYTGIVERHSRRCRRSREGADAACDCKPSFRAWVYDQRSGTKIMRTHATLAAAKTWRRDALSAVGRGKMSAPTKTTLRESWEAWYAGATTSRPTTLTRSGRPYKPSVLRSYEADMRLYVLPDLGAVRFSEVRRRDLQAIIDRLLGRGLSPSKVRNVCMPVRALYRHAVERDVPGIDVNPTSNLRLPTGLGTRDRVVDVNEAEQLVRLVPEQDRAVWATAFYAGLRLGELRGLRVEDVDLDAGLIRVVRSWDAKEGEVDPKSRKGTRRVPVVAPLRGYLQEQLKRTKRSGSDLVFGATASRPFTPSHLRRRAARYWAVAAVGAFIARTPLRPPLEPVGFHELRHSFVTFAHESGMSLEEIGDLVGHSSTYMSERYRHLRDARRDVLAARLDDYHRLAFTGARIEQIAAVEEV